MATLLREKPAWARGSTASLFKLPIESFVSGLLSSLPDSHESKKVAPAATQALDAPAARPTCLACGLTFDSRSDQVFHFKSDAHRVCLQRRLNGDTLEPNHAIDGKSSNPEDEDEDDQDDEDDDEEDGDDKEDGDDETGGGHESGGQNWWLRTGHPTVVVAGPRVEGSLPWGVGLPVALVSQSRKDIR